MSQQLNSLPPYPRLGEIYRALALALDTKQQNRKLDQWAREESCHWNVPHELLEELFEKPLAKYVDEEFGRFVTDHVRAFHKFYIDLIKTVAVDGLDRESVLPSLMDYAFLHWGSGVLLKAITTFDGPSPTQLLDRDVYCVDVVLSWVEQRLDKPLASSSSLESADTAKSFRDSLLRWRKGEQKPSLHKIKLIGDMLVNENHATSLRRWLIIARALAWFEEHFAEPGQLRQKMLWEILMGMPAHDVGRILSEQNRQASDFLKPLVVPGLLLQEQLKRTVAKTVGDQAKAKKQLDDFRELIAKHDLDGRTGYWVEWFTGRWHVLSGELEAAISHYETAVDLCLYRAGENQKQILEEAMVLAAKLKRKPLFKRLKHQAVFLGLLAEPDDKSEEIVPSWELQQAADCFAQVFPSSGWFVEAVERTATAVFPFFLYAAEGVPQKPDLRNPDRVISVYSQDQQKRRYPQLRWFASEGKVTEVNALLEKDASVDQLDASGGSALLCAMQYATETGDRKVLDLLLAHPHKEETLNRVTDKKRLTPLLQAIELGEPDVVAKLLEMGASAELRGTVDDQTPLYFCLGRMALAFDPGKLTRSLQEKMQDHGRYKFSDALRRYGGASFGLFGGIDQIRKNMQEPGYELLWQALVQTELSRYSLSKLIEIARLLLRYDADPNAPHQRPAPGRTPLMLAAESDLIEAFKLMVEYGGNPLQPDGEKMDCWKIALGFRSRRVIGFLRENEN